jgi:hypothetical protein
MTQWKTLHGEGGELFVFRAGILFARAESFACPLSRDTVKSGLGTNEELVTGYGFQLVLNSVTVADSIGASEYIRELQHGEDGVFSFQGTFSRYDGNRERVQLTECRPMGANIEALVRGNIPAWAFDVCLDEPQLARLWAAI